MNPMTAEDLADTIWWVATLPPHLNINAHRADADQPELGRLRGQRARVDPARARGVERAAMSIDQRLAELGITLPAARRPGGRLCPRGRSQRPAAHLAARSASPRTAA